MKYFLILGIMFSFSSYAHDYCYTHGDCQKGNQTIKGTQCFNAKTGVDNYGNQTCALRCITVEFGNKCHFFDNNVYGVCVQEKIKPVPVTDPNDPNKCDSAVDLWP